MIARLAGAVAALMLGVSGAARAEPPVWIVRDHDSELVLFGSVHLLPPGLAWRPARLDRALRRADDLWFELPVDAASEQATARLAAQRGLLSPDQSLFKLLPPDDGARLLRLARRYGVDPETLDRLQPWLADLALSEAVYRQAGASAEAGVEKTLSAAAQPRTRRKALETPEEQIGFLAGAPLADQLAELSESLKELEEAPDAYQRLLEAWMAGDLVALDEQALAPMRRAAPRLYARLVADRNARWAARLDQRLRGRGRTVVVVGVGHLAGPDSLPARLRALGYKVEGP